jgi:hypothetical protein
MSTTLESLSSFPEPASSSLPVSLPLQTLPPRPFDRHHPILELPRPARLETDRVSPVPRKDLESRRRGRGGVLEVDLVEGQGHSVKGALGVDKDLWEWDGADRVRTSKRSGRS